MAKSADAFRTISEVADWLETPAHVLRFWESKFSQVKPVKRAGGRRYYRPTDMKLLGGIKKLLHEDGMTIKGVQKILREQGVRHVAGLSQPLGLSNDEDLIEAEAVTEEPPEEKGTVLNFQRGGETDEAPAVSDAEVPAEKSGQSDTDTSVRRAESQAPAPGTQNQAAGAQAGAAEKQAAARPDDAIDEPQPTLPSFQHLRGKSEAPQAEDETGGGEHHPEIAPLRTEVPEDPADDIAADAGPLTHITRLRRPLTAETAARLAPFLDRLREKVESYRQE